MSKAVQPFAEFPNRPLFAFTQLQTENRSALFLE